MTKYPSPNAIKRIEEHFVHSRQAIHDIYSGIPSRLLAIFNLFENALQNSYIAGEGWVEEDVHKMIDAVSFVAEKHRSQFRQDKDQTPYLGHLLSVTHHLMFIGRVRDPEVLIASLLHDTLEDTETSYQELVDHFGERVARFVQEVTDDKSLPKEERKHLQIITAQKKSAGAAQIKLADKWDNLKDLLHFPPEEWSSQRIADYVAWAQEVTEALPWVNANLFRSVEQVIEEF
jgi:guanosine-3',5'-bis(diphosphate) 3'-pyrophosphohydrolase